MQRVHNSSFWQKRHKWYSQIYWDSTRNCFSPSRWQKRPANAVVIHDIVSVSVSVSVVIVIVIVVIVIVIVIVVIVIIVIIVRVWIIFVNNKRCNLLFQ